jgi:predicted transcriptional regulator
MMSDIGQYPAPIRAMVRLPLEARLWSALREDPNQSVRMLARRLNTQRSAVHPALTRLMKLGLLSYEVRPCGKRPPRYRVSDHSENSETEQAMT